jgi:hypothetical protein
MNTNAGMPDQEPNVNDNLNTVERRRLARAALLDRVLAQPVVEIGRWTREELYA